MMILIFLLYSVANGLAWKGERRWATLVIGVTLVLSAAWFRHHITANVLTTFLMCGVGGCPDNPTAYMMLPYLLIR
jgi:hypothetical protein